MSPLHITQTGTGPPLLLLHGWGFDQQVWSLLLPKLSKNYTVYRVDLPGFGETPCMSWDEFTKALLPQLPEKVALLGWSMGGLFATRLALEYPLRVSHIIHLSSSPYFVEQKNWPGITDEQLHAFYESLKLDPQKTHRDFIALQVPKHTPLPPLPQINNIAGLKAGLDILKTWDFRELIHQLELPTAYLFGRLDRIVPARTMTCMQATYPYFHYELIKKAGHAPFLSHPDDCVNFLNRFIKDT